MKGCVPGLKRPKRFPSIYCETMHLERKCVVSWALAFHSETTPTE